MTVRLPLHLTSALMHGNVVINCQNLLKKNRFGSFYSGDADGRYGEMTAQAAYRAHYWCGYPDRRLKQIGHNYGEELRSYLRGPDNGGSRLPLTYLARRKLRLRKAQAVPLRIKAFNEGLKYVGVEESPYGSNNVLFSRWYGVRGPWCAMYVSYCYAHIGSKFRYSYCPSVVGDAREGRNGLSITHNPQKGDLVLYNMYHNGISNHIGMFDTWLDGSRSRFMALEGNTSSSSQDNGGKVMKRERSTSIVLCYVHVGR